MTGLVADRTECPIDSNDTWRCSKEMDIQASASLTKDECVTVEFTRRIARALHRTCTFKNIRLLCHRRKWWTGFGEPRSALRIPGVH